MYNVKTRGITTPNVVVGMAIFAGGLTQFIAGMWEFPRGNVFGTTGASKPVRVLSIDHSHQFPSVFLLRCFLDVIRDDV
jgi:hypothetical protein